VGLNLTDAAAAAYASQTSALSDAAPDILRAAEAAVRRDADDDLGIIVEHVPDTVDRLLVDLSKQASLIVLACDDVAVGPAILIGSTTIAVAANAACPVVAWRGGATAPTGEPIVLGVGGDDSCHAITAAFELADRLGVRLVAVHAWSTRRSVGDVTLPYMTSWEAVKADQEKFLVDTLAPWTLRFPEVVVNHVVDRDKPSRALLRHSENAQLVVVGGRGRGPVAGALLGSTGLNLLHHSAIPTMICRSRNRGSGHHEYRRRAGSSLTDLGMETKWSG
jgi:nucleotide-binding universal stress UspA family protein